VTRALSDDVGRDPPDYLYRAGSGQAAPGTPLLK